MRLRAVRYVILGQLIFVATILSCVAIAPSVLLSNQALSTYGSLPATFGFFVVGLLAVAATLVRAAIILPRHSSADRMLARLFSIIAALMAGLAITPVLISDFFYAAHFTLASVLGVVNVGTGWWLLSHARQDIANYSLYGLEIIGGALCVFSTAEVGLLDIMATGQIIAIFSFAALITRTVPQIEHVKVKTLV